MKQKSTEERSLKANISGILCVLFISVSMTCCTHKTPEENIVDQLGDSIFAVYIHTELYDSAERKVRAGYKRELEKLQQEMMYGGYAVQFDERQFVAILKEKMKKDIEKENNRKPSANSVCYS